MAETQNSGLTGLGKTISFLLIVGLIALGGWVVAKRFASGGPRVVSKDGGGAPVAGGGAKVDGKGGGKLSSADLAETKMSAPRLTGAPLAYVPSKANVIDIELSKYAGYAGLIAINGGLTPNPDSAFTKKNGFQLNIVLSEEESWNALNSGKMAASATTADVLAVYGRQFQVVVPAQIGYSRGADALVVRNDIKTVNQLKGRIVVAPQFTESDFFIRYLAQEAGLSVNMMADAAAAVDPGKINLIFCDDGEKVAKVMLDDIKSGADAISAAVTWAPYTTDIVSGSGGKARALVSNKNLLIVADILIVNRGFAEKNADKVAAIVDGLLAGNKMVRENPEASADLIGKAMSTAEKKWDRAKTIAELQKVHLSNLPEQMAFFSGGITQGGSFASIYQSAVLAYGNDLVPNPVDSDHFLALDALKKIEQAGTYKDQVAAIVPIQNKSTGPVEPDPLLSRDVRFYFEVMSADLDSSKKENLDDLKSIKRLLDVSPGSRVLLVGHVDNSNIPNLRRTGGEELVQKMALEAVDLSKRRATEIRNQLVNREKVDPKRIETQGRGWNQPVSTENIDLNRRVEVQWFTLE